VVLVGVVLFAIVFWLVRWSFAGSMVLSVASIISGFAIQLMKLYGPGERAEKMSSVPEVQVCDATEGED
jgi:hypothetical protein